MQRKQQIEFLWRGKENKIFAMFVPAQRAVTHDG
jgi:hypothetical protein